DLQLQKAMGQALPRVLAGETEMREAVDPELLKQTYSASAIGTASAHAQLAALVKQLTHRFPKMRILEVGGGAAATKAILGAVPPSRYTSYTFTDVAEEALDAASKTLSTYSGGRSVAFKKLDLNKAPREQGFTPNSY